MPEVAHQDFFAQIYFFFLLFFCLFVCFFFLFSSMEFFTGLVLNLLQTICEDNVWTGRQIVSQLCVLQLLHSDSLFL